jgi:glutamine amidotransferase
MSRLTDSGLRDTLEAVVRSQKRPVLGICVGMQIMADVSDEGTSEGLGWIHARVRKFEHEKFDHAPHVPHMGWNDVQPREGEELFRGLETGARFYFLHSYYFAPAEEGHVLASTNYGGRFASSVRSGNVFGVQFHPEKSHQWGIRLLENFAKL